AQPRDRKALRSARPGAALPPWRARSPSRERGSAQFAAAPARGSCRLLKAIQNFDAKGPPGSCTSNCVLHFNLAPARPPAWFALIGVLIFLQPPDKFLDVRQRIFRIQRLTPARPHRSRIPIRI